MSDAAIEDPVVQDKAEDAEPDAVEKKSSRAKTPKTKATPKAKASPVKKQKKAVSDLHPKYNQMINEAIAALKDRTGSSRQAILKYIVANYNVLPDEKLVNNHIKMSIRAGVKSGKLKQSKGSGACGSYKLGDKGGEKPKTPKSKSPAKKANLTKVKKPKSTSKKSKSPAKKSPSKDSGKATPEKAKSPAKKATKKRKSPKKTKAKKAAKSPKKATKDTEPEPEPETEAAGADSD